MNACIRPASSRPSPVGATKYGHPRATCELNRVVAAVVPPVVYEVLDSLDLTALVGERVDIDELVCGRRRRGHRPSGRHRRNHRPCGHRRNRTKMDINAIVSKLDIDAIPSSGGH